MATRMSLWKLNPDGSATPLPEERLSREDQIESAVESAPELLGVDVLIIDRQTPTPSGPLDLLALDGDGRLVIVENKRDRTPRDVLAQAIDYAAWFLQEVLGCMARNWPRSAPRHPIARERAAIGAHQAPDHPRYPGCADGLGVIGRGLRRAAVRRRRARYQRGSAHFPPRTSRGDRGYVRWSPRLANPRGEWADDEADQGRDTEGCHRSARGSDPGGSSRARRHGPPPRRCSQALPERGSRKSNGGRRRR